MRTALFVVVILILVSSFAMGQTIQKGDFTPSVGSEGWSLSSGTGERIFIEFVTFEKPFDVPPTVVVSLAGFDATGDENRTTRIHVIPDKITKAGCVLKIKAWGSSKVNAVYGSWLAIGK